MRRTPTLLSALLLATLLCFVQVPAALAQGGAPGAPTNLQAIVSGNNLTMTWSAPATGGAPTSYTLVGRATAGGTVLGTLALGNVTSFTAAHGRVGVGPRSA